MTARVHFTSGQFKIPSTITTDVVSAILLTKEKIEVGQTITIPEFFQYNLVNILINNGTIINNGALNIL